MTVARVYPDGGHIVMDDASGHEVWSTRRPPVNLLADSDALVLTGFNIEFPEFEKRFHYGYWRGPSGSNPTGLEAAVSILALRPGDYNLPDITVGSVPSGVNYLDVRVNMTRTVNPISMGTTAIPTEFAPGKTTFLPGGSCEVEKFLNFSRLFWFELSGTNVVLKRRQSVQQLRPPFIPQFTTDYLANRFSTGGGDLAQFSPPIAVMQSVGPVLNVDNARRRGGPQAMRTDVENFNTRSVYTGTVTIRPGYINCTGTGCAMNGGRSISVERQPVTEWYYSNTGVIYQWTARTDPGLGDIGTLMWNNVEVAGGIGYSETEYAHPDGWIYMRGPLVQSFPTNNQYRIARRRETVVSS